MRFLHGFAGVRRVLLWQLGVVVAGGMAAFVVGGWGSATSAVIGGLIAFIPNAFFALFWGCFHESKGARHVLHAFYVGEALKLALTGVLFFLAFQFREIEHLPLFVGFVVTLGVFWFALLQRTLND
jgi:ATP synthase protein I